MIRKVVVCRVVLGGVRADLGRLDKIWLGFEVKDVGILLGRFGVILSFLV